MKQFYVPLLILVCNHVEAQSNFARTLCIRHIRRVRFAARHLGPGRLTVEQMAAACVPVQTA
jgi:hypothetical protein